MNPQVIIIAGPNGAGKSTLAPILLRDELGLMELVNAVLIASGEEQTTQNVFEPERWASFCEVAK